LLIDACAIRKDQISKCPLVLVVSVGLDGDFLPKGKVRSGLLGSLAEGLALLWAIDATETDTFRAVIVQDFEGVAVEDGDDGTGEIRRKYGARGIGRL